MIKSYNFVVDIKEKSDVPKIECVIGDTNAYRLNINLVDKAKPIDLTSQIVRLVSRKSDSTTVFQDFDVVDEITGSISTVLKSQAVSCLGSVTCEIKIYGLNEELLTSGKFIYTVVPSLLDEDAVESVNEFSALTTALAALGNVATVTQLATKASQSALDATNSAVALKANQADLAAEITNLAAQKAEKANQSDLQSESSSRSTKDSDLQAQISAIVLQGTSGDSSAEVAQARTNTAGSSHNTIKSHFDNIEKSVFPFVDKKYSYKWTPLGIQVGSPTDCSANANRISTPMIYADEDLVVNISGNYHFGIQTFTNNGGVYTFVADLGWKTTKYVIAKGTYFRIQVSNLVETPISDVFGDVFESISMDYKNSLSNDWKSYLMKDYALYFDVENTVNNGGYPRFSTDALTCTINATASNAGVIIDGVNYSFGSGVDLAITLDVAGWGSSLGAILYNFTTNTFLTVKYSDIANYKNTCVLLAMVRYFAGYPLKVWMKCPFYVDGKLFGVDYATSADLLTIQPNYNINTIKAVNHRGYNTIAPEDTLPAYKLSKKYGYEYVECDVALTSDGVPVILHDETIDRTSDGTGAVNSLTYAQLLAFDFGSWKSADYAGTKIPTFDEFISLCKKLGLKPYIELKYTATYTQEQVNGLVAIVKKYNMLADVTWISFTSGYLAYVKNADSKTRLGFIFSGTITSTVIDTVNTLKTTENEVFLDSDYTTLTADGIQLCVDSGIPIEVWTMDDEGYLLTMNGYVSGVTTNTLDVGKSFYNNLVN